MTIVLDANEGWAISNEIYQWLKNHIQQPLLIDLTNNPNDAQQPIIIQINPIKEGEYEFIT